MFSLPLIAACSERNESAQKEIKGSQTQIFELPKAWPNISQEATYATEVFIYAGCESNPPTVLVVKGQQNQDACANLIAIAARYDNGDYYEVEAQFDWYVTEPNVISLTFPYGPHDNLCQIHGLTDIFDSQGDAEPQTIVSACAANLCPDQKPADCQDQVCAEMVYVSVVNLEGTWLMTGATFEADAEMNPTQNGRRFKDQANGVKDGRVLGTAVRFEIDDYLYQGIFTDRDHIQGEVTELMGDSTMGSWQAERAYL